MKRGEERKGDRWRRGWKSRSVGEQCEQVFGDGGAILRKIIYGSDKKRRVEPLSKSHASPFTQGPPIFRNINPIALRTPFASRCLHRGLSGSAQFKQPAAPRYRPFSPPPPFLFLPLFFLFHFLAL